ncbi:hypothetical protein ACP275_04G126800 [Erythranthe tilingii]
MSHYSSMEEDPQEMQLLSFPTPPPPPPLPPTPSSQYPPPWPPSTPARFGPYTTDHNSEGPSLDLQLSISVKKPLKLRQVLRSYNNNNNNKIDSSCTDALKWQAAEQIRLAAMERAYAERVMELTRREMELAQSEFMRARSLWERAREEVERAENMKRQRSANSSTCMEITCLSCRQKFRPN